MKRVIERERKEESTVTLIEALKKVIEREKEECTVTVKTNQITPVRFRDVTANASHCQPLPTQLAREGDSLGVWDNGRGKERKKGRGLHVCSYTVMLFVRLQLVSELTKTGTELLRA